MTKSSHFKSWTFEASRNTPVIRRSCGVQHLPMLDQRKIPLMHPIDGTPMKHFLSFWALEQIVGDEHSPALRPHSPIPSLSHPHPIPSPSELSLPAQTFFSSFCAQRHSKKRVHYFTEPRFLSVSIPASLSLFLWLYQISLLERWDPKLCLMLTVLVSPVL